MVNPPPSLKTLWLSVLELRVLTSPIGYHWQCVCSQCACAVSRDLCVGCKFFPHIWNLWPRFAYALCNFYGATIKTNGVIRQNSVWLCVKDHIVALRMHKITSALNAAVNLLPPSFSATTISCLPLQMLAIWQHLEQFLAIFSLRMRRSGYLWTSG